MKENLAILFFLMLTFTIAAQLTEEELLKKNFDSYISVLSKARGMEAVNYVDSHTIPYYNDIAELARDVDSLKIETLPLLDKIMVLATRHRVSKENLLKYDGKELFIYAIDHRMVDTFSSTNLRLGTVSIENDSAKAQMIVLGVGYPLYLNFYKEGGQWKYDLTSSFDVGVHVLKKYADEFGEKLVIKMVLNADHQNKPSPNIWRPL